MQLLSVMLCIVFIYTIYELLSMAYDQFIDIWIIWKISHLIPVRLLPVPCITLILVAINFYVFSIFVNLVWGAP